jgi:uncharacterized protein (DUF1697 family)
VSTTPDADVWVALIRGINVGRNRRVRMAELREALSAAGAHDVSTVLQSGNVVLTAPGGADDVARLVADAVRACSGHEVAVVVRSAAEFARVVAANPLPDPPDGARFLVTFLERSAADVDLPELPEGSTEQWWRGDREVYVWCPDGLTGSSVMSTYAGARAPLATARNWNTVTALARLVQA